MFWKQLKLLLWKNFILRKRHVVRTIIEILWPLFLFAILVAIRKTQPIETETECHYPGRAMPSAGVYPWLKSLLCDLQNPCFETMVPSEVPGQVNSPIQNANNVTDVATALIDVFTLFNTNTSIVRNISQINNDLQTLTNITANQTVPVSSLLRNPTSYKSFLESNLSLSSSVVDSILSSNVSLAQALTFSTLLGRRTIVCNSTLLNAAIPLPTTSAPGNLTDVSNELCGLNDTQLTLLSSYTGESLVNVTTLSSMFQGPDTSQVTDITDGLSAYASELQAIQGPLTSLLQNLPALEDLGSTSLLSSLLGFNTSSPDAFNQFCDHPSSQTTGLTQLISAGISSVITDALNNSSNFCSSLINAFESDTKYSFFWDTIKPLLLGKIPFSPNTPLVRSIIAKANSTFEAIGIIESFGENWQSTIGPLLYQSLENGTTANLLRTLLDSTMQLNLIAAQFNVSVASLEQLKTFLSNEDNPDDSVVTWKDVYNQLNSGIVLITQILQCVELDKFVPFTDETSLVDYSIALVNSKSLWGSIVFVNPTVYDTTLPKIVKYKIRQDAGAVTRTTDVQRFFWRPGAEVGPTSRVKYYGSGFVHIQDMVENAVVETTIDNTSSNSAYNLVFGKYLQGMPYPCYTRDNYWIPEANADYSSNDMAYYFGGFLFLQDILEHGILSSHQSNLSISEPSLGIYLQESPYPCYTYDEFLEYLSGMLSLLMTLAWVYSVCIIIKSIVYEKEQRLKEVMKMMGLTNGVHWVAWFINSFVVMLCSVILLIIVLKAGDVTPFSNMFIVFLWMLCFVIATIMQCFLISCFFTRANLAAACGGIIFFVLYIPYNMVYAFRDEMTLSTKLIASLLSTVAFGYGSAYISQYEMSGVGIQFDNWATSPDPQDDFNFLTSMIMMLVDALIYMILAWYIENVFPGTYGVPRPWYFFVTKSYWCGVSNKKATSTSDHADVDDGHQSGVKLEAEPQHLQLGVAIHHLRKVYGNGKVAVDDLSLNFYEGQITSFLGHNGAGKTTTMSMLTGLFTPTSGSAQIYGNDIQTEMDEIRHQLGFCPQHNVLFGDLTVMEHLQLYAGLKCAVKGTDVDDSETDQMLIDVGLPHKKSEISDHLSGGMKRKLSVAVAFVGGSKCVILDEPTAGVDPYARRGIWDLLLRFRANRTILLSTHHMDEADLLGDRIAIISHGKLKCCGSSLYLKSCFGVGYYLTVIKNNSGKEATGVDQVDPTKATDEAITRNAILPPIEARNKQFDSLKQNLDEGFESNSDNMSSHASTSTMTPVSDEMYQPVNDIGKKTTFAPDIVHSSHITNLIFKTIPKARIQEENPREMTFVLPYSGQANGRYSDLFGKLDECGVTYGLTDTSLEEIFLSVAEQSKDDGKEEDTKCCFCIPRRRKHSVTPAPSPEAQARHGSRRRTYSRSISSGISEGSYAPLVRQKSVSFVLDEDEEDGLTSNVVDDGSQGKGSYKVSGNQLVWQQFKALFVKRFHHSRRNVKGIVAQVIVPAVFVALALLFTLVIPTTKNMPPLEMQPWMYGDTNTFYSNDMKTSNLSNSVSDALLNYPSLGMRCVNGYTVLNYDDDYITCDNVHGQVWAPDVATEGLSQDSDLNSSLTCKCTDKETRVLLAECPYGAGGEPTPRVLTQTSDWMYNMTGRNVSDWLVKTVDFFIKRRYGGLSMGEKFHGSLSADQLSPLIQLAEANSNFTLNTSNNSTESVNQFVEGLARSENAKVWFDNNGYHSMPTWLNILNNAALRSSLPAGENPMEYGIAAVNHPLNFTSSTVDLAALTQSITDTLISISVIFALSFVPASFVLFLIEEKVSKSKHLQFVSGVNQSIYWISTFLWDMVNYIVPIIIVLFIFLCFQTKAYVSAQNFPCLVLLLLLYGFSITPMMYPASFYFEVPSTAYVVLTCVNLFIGINTSIATFILELLDDPTLTDVNNVLTKVFLIFPQYCLGRGLIDMSINQAYADVYASFGVDSFVNPFTFDLVGRNLMAMAIEGVFFFALTLLMQYRFFIKPKAGVLPMMSAAPSDQDEDVVEERERILSGGANDILHIRNLTKVYTKRGSDSRLVAVDRLCVGVPEGECFGLLGVNGAGKTTTFKMLTGDTTPTGGDAFICNQSILDHLREVQQNTGYCPQFEALNSLLTGREHLIFYAKLRGVPPEDTDRVADWAVSKFGLKVYANKPAGTYSGGNKRKLCAAIAFIGCPPIVFLDEPTAGMDPMSRRFLWGRIAEAVRGGRCIVLTSHSMEECEALCTRLAIMVNGQLKCIGSPQHLKNRYGEGYTITIKVGGLNVDLEAVKNFVTSSFQNAILKETHCNMMMYQLPLEDVRLADLFKVMESNKASMNIEDYSVSQTTLDEVFVSFAMNQTDGLEEEYGLPQGDVAATHANAAYSNVVENSEDFNSIPGADGIIMQNMSSTYSGHGTDKLLV